MIFPVAFLKWTVRQGLLETATGEEMHALATVFLPGDGRRRDESETDFRSRLIAAGNKLTGL